MFNNSTDRTACEVDRFINSHDIKCKLYYDTDTAYLQPLRFNKMADEAFKDGCTWMVPVDADEIVRIKNDMDIYSFLKQFDRHSFGYINCRWIDYHPKSSDNQDDQNFFSKWEHRSLLPRKQSKVIVKWKKGMHFGDGHHLITSHRNLIAESVVMFYAHFYGRSYEQLDFKTKTISKAFVEYFGIDSERPQVASYKELQEKGDQYTKDAWEKLCLQRKTMKLVHDPIPKHFFS